MFSNEPAGHDIVETLELNQDIYSLTFHQMQKSTNSIWHRDLMMKSVLTWMMQLSLCGLLFNKIQAAGLNSVFTGTVYLNSTRLLCSILLHI